jgi:DNA-binding transcriptional regulator YiaG
MLPEDFKTIREEIGSQFKVASLLGVSQGQISIWEKGYRPIPEQYSLKIVKIRKEM